MAVLLRFTVPSGNTVLCITEMEFKTNELKKLEMKTKKGNENTLHDQSQHQQIKKFQL